MAATAPNTEITNTAIASYLVGAVERVTEDSIALVTTNRTPAIVEFLTPFAAGESLNIPQGEYAGSSARGSPEVWVPLNSTLLGVQKVSPATLFDPNGEFIVRLTDLDQNRDENQIETVVVVIGNPDTGDLETLRLYETALDSGVFAASIKTVFDESAAQGNGTIEVTLQSEMTVSYEDEDDRADATSAYGIFSAKSVVFDSMTGEPIDGAVVRLRSVTSNSGAFVFAVDGRAWPAEVVSGEQSSERGSDGASSSGVFQYPRVIAGQYRLEVVPPEGYVYPSERSNADLAQFAHLATQVTTGSKGEVFDVTDHLSPIRINIPLDRFTNRISLQKTAEQSTAAIGDVIEYRLQVKNQDAVNSIKDVKIVDTLPFGFRYVPNSTGLDGQSFDDDDLIAENRHLTFKLGDLEPSATHIIRYQVRIGAGAQLGENRNKAVIDVAGLISSPATADVKIIDDLMVEKALLVGRVTKGPCENPDQHEGVAGARIYFESGKSVITDKNGRWHLTGILTGTHVLQLDPLSLPAGYEAKACKKTARHAGAEDSQMVELRGGDLKSVNFHVVYNPELESAGPRVKAPEIYKLPDNPLETFDATYLRKQKPGLEVLWPPKDFVPSVSSISLAVKYDKGQKIVATLNGHPINPLNAAGQVSDSKVGHRIKLWKGIDVKRGRNTLLIQAKDSTGKVVAEEKRTVFFTETLTRVEIDQEASILIADGRSVPIIALRLTNDEGFSARPRSLGHFSLGSNEWSLLDSKTDALEPIPSDANGRYGFKVDDDGLVRVRLNPTTRSGNVPIRVYLGQGQEVDVQAWLQPVLREWILVGYAKGTVGYNKLSGNMERFHQQGIEAGSFKKGRTSFFAKGRIKGDFLLSLAYDSDKPSREVGEDLSDVVDPDAWYKLYGDASTSHHEAPSSEKLYLKLEKEQFYALYGDYQTDFDETSLAPYNRTMQGLKSELRGDKYGYQLFVNQTSNRFQRDEIIADGTPGLYYMSREALQFSEKVVIEVRDRFNPAKVIEQRVMQRFVDYDIDYSAKSLFFKFPVSSRDDMLNPQYIVVTYESEDESGDKLTNAGLRLSSKFASGKGEAGISYLYEEDNGNLVAFDVKHKINSKLYIKAEAAQSENLDNEKAKAIEAGLEYKGGKLKSELTYRRTEAGFGLGQQSSIGQGSQRWDLTAEYLLNEKEKLKSTLRHQESLTGSSKISSASATWQRKDENLKLELGLRNSRAESPARESNNTQVIAQAQRYFLDKKLTIRAGVEGTVSGDKPTEQIPDRISLGAEYKLSQKTSLFAEVSRADSTEKVSTNTRIGLKSNPWEGGQIHSSLLRETDQLGDRDYAVLGINQSWAVSDHWTIKAGVDSATTISISEDALTDSMSDGPLRDDFWAVNVGADWEKDDVRARIRASVRKGDLLDSSSLELGAVKQVDDELAITGSLTDTRQINHAGNTSDRFVLSVGAVSRPDHGNSLWMDRLEYVMEENQNDEGYSHTNKLINNFHYQRQLTDDISFNLHHGLRLADTKADGRPDTTSTTDTLQVSSDYSINEKWDVSAHGGYLHTHDSNQVKWYSGVGVGFSPMKNTRIEAGYNFQGFEDEDFSTTNYTFEGPYINFTYRLDRSLLKWFIRDEEELKAEQKENKP